MVVLANSLRLGITWLPIKRKLLTVISEAAALGMLGVLAVLAVLAGASSLPPHPTTDSNNAVLKVANITQTCFFIPSPFKTFILRSRYAKLITLTVQLVPFLVCSVRPQL